MPSCPTALPARPARGGPAALLSALALALALALVAALPTPAGAAPERAEAAPTAQRAPALPGGVALTWSPAYMTDSHAFTREQARSLAQRHDLVVSMPVAFGQHASAMRAAHPGISLLAYANATLAGASDVTGLGEGAFAHDAQGRRITATGWGTRLMEPTNAAWRERASRQCAQRSAAGGFDGCLLDMLTLGIFAKGFVSALPVNPATGRTYTQPEYQAQMVALESHVRRANPGLQMTGNVVENAYRYWQNPVATSRTAALRMPSVQMEDFLRGATNEVGRFPAPADWVRNVEVIRDLESNGRVGLFTTKLWVGASDAQVRQWQGYAMATFLMGAGGRSFFAFTRSRDRAGVLGTNLPYRMPKGIGAPTGAMSRLGSGAYLRRFERGVAVVNPTDRGVQVPLGSTMRRLDGGSTASVWLPPHSGDVLTGAGAARPSADVRPPSVRFQGPATARGPLRLRGVATDDRGVRAVRLAVRHEATRRWLRPGGGWGAHAQRAATLQRAGDDRTGWSRTLRLPRGRYGVSVVAVDAAGNLTRSRPWRVYRVR